MKTRKVKTPNGWAVGIYDCSNDGAVIVFSNGLVREEDSIKGTKEFDDYCDKLQRGETEPQLKGLDL